MQFLFALLFFLLGWAQALRFHGGHGPASSSFGIPTLNSSIANISSVSNATAGTFQTPSFTYSQLLNLTTTFFDTFVYPNNGAEAKKINSTLFSEDVLGRVDVTRTFNGRELNTEYAFGLFSHIALNPNSFTLLGVPIHYEIAKFVANQNIISLDTIVTFNISALNVQAPVEVIFFATFNALGQINQYDATFRFLEWQFDWLLQRGMTMFGFNSTTAVISATSGLLAQSICATATTYCTGDNLQYNSTAACLDFLTKGIRFGTGYELGMNTLMCRMVHQNMVPFRPDVHCSHIVSLLPPSSTSLNLTNSGPRVPLEADTAQMT